MSAAAHDAASTAAVNDPDAAPAKALDAAPVDVPDVAAVSVSEAAPGNAPVNAHTSAPVTAYIGIGANLGDARANVLDAVERLKHAPGCVVTAVSSLYRTAPIDSSGDDYVNAVAAIETTLEAHALLQTLHDIEQAHGRERPYRNAPRTLDLDLLLYGQEQINTVTLTVPHPRMCERAFVIVPLVEIATGIMIPGRAPALCFASAVKDQEITKETP